MFMLILRPDDPETRGGGSTPSSLPFRGDAVAFEYPTTGSVEIGGRNGSAHWNLTFTHRGLQIQAAHLSLSLVLHWFLQTMSRQKAKHRTSRTPWH